METLICPVSTQVLPNILTALHLKPQKVILLSTRKMQKFVNYHKNILKMAGIETHDIEINPYDAATIKKVVPYLDNESMVLLNCGTKFTAITLFKLASRSNAKAVYYLPEGKIVDFEGREISRIPDNLIDVQTHAEIYGFHIIGEVEEIKSIRLRKNLTEYIAKNYEKISKTLKKLYQEGKLSIQSFPGELFRLLKNFNIVEEKKGKLFTINRDYIGGKWLEEFVFLRLLSMGFYDVRIGVKVSWKDFENIINEIDVMAIKNNTLHIFSCKTGDNLHEIKKHLYELEELTEQIGGDFGRSFLIVTPDIFPLKMPDRSQFPNIPRVSYYRNKHIWYKYYKTPEGKSYRKAYGKFAASKNVLNRAKLLGVKVINLNDFKEENLD